MRVPATLTTLLLALCAACPADDAESMDEAGDSSDTDDATDTGATGDTGESGDTGDTGGTGGAALDLFECGLSSPCTQIFLHIDPEPEEAMVCAAQLIASGEPGVIRALEDIGPSPDETESLIVLVGDGTAVVQRRYHDDYEAPWTVYEHELCNVVFSADSMADCALDPVGPTCRWHPFYGGLEDCEPIEDHDCASIDAILGG